jgi:hypothetical protein
MFGVRSTVRANLPSAYAFSLVSPPPPKIAMPSGPCSAWIARTRSATRSSASSHDAGASSPSAPRTSGVVSRSGTPSTVALVQPFWHSPPRLVGNSRGVTVTGRAARPSGAAAVVTDDGAPAGVRSMPHCRAQYGQWVGTALIRAPPAWCRARRRSR